MRKQSIICVLILLVTLLSGCFGLEGLPKKATLTGRIYDQSGKPFSGAAAVTLNGKSGSLSGSAFSFSNLSPGTKTLRVEAPEYELYSRQVQLSAGENTHDVHLVKIPQNGSEENGGEENEVRNTGTLTGKIYVGNSQDLVLTLVTVVLDGPLARTALVRDGEYEFREVPVGTASITATADGFERYEAVIEIRDTGTTHDLRLEEIEPTGSIPLRALEFVMKPIPRGIRSPSSYGPVPALDYDLTIGEHEVTYGLWQQVFEWATDAAQGRKRYYFQNPGVMGNDGGAEKTEQHPVTEINWRDAVIWCNALTEYYNALHGTALACVYLSNGKVIRDSRDAEAQTFENLLDYPAANDGFRLPTLVEWRLAARYVGNTAPEDVRVEELDGHYFTHVDYPSGATKAYYYVIDVGAVAWYEDNSGGNTHPVGLKRPNQLGIYDMNGNVWEWCWDYTGGSFGYSRDLAGGSFDFSWLNVQQSMSRLADYKSDSVGLRLARRTGS